MTRWWSGDELARRIRQDLPDVVEGYDEHGLWVRPAALPEVGRLLRDAPDLDFRYLNLVTGVDCIEHFDVVYLLTSLTHNAMAVLKARVYGREAPTVPTVTHLWRGADYLEREVWDLMGIRFEGHPNLKRLMLWEGFPGHPLRKDFKGVGLPEGVEWARPNV